MYVHVLACTACRAGRLASYGELQAWTGRRQHTWRRKLPPVPSSALPDKGCHFRFTHTHTGYDTHTPTVLCCCCCRRTYRGTRGLSRRGAQHQGGALLQCGTVRYSAAAHKISRMCRSGGEAWVPRGSPYVPLAACRLAGVRHKGGQCDCTRLHTDTDRYTQIVTAGGVL